MRFQPAEESLFVDRAVRDPDAPVPAFVTIQRVVVRMLFDPSFVARVYENPSQELGDLDLPESLIDQLLRNDRRLWQADTLRRSRALEILMDEFKISSTLALAETGELAFLDAFFFSPHFHRAVQRRSYMALAYVDYLREQRRRGLLTTPQFGAVLELESAMARSRREFRDAKRGFDAATLSLQARPALLTQPGVRSLIVSDQLIPVIQHIEKYLFEIGLIPALALCRDAPRPDPLPILGDGVTAMLLEPQPSGKVEMSEIQDRFHHVIAVCEPGVLEQDLPSAVAPRGIDAEGSQGIVEALLDASVLRRIH